MRLRSVIAAVLIACTLSSSVACGAKIPPATPSAQLVAYEQTAIAALQAVAASAQIAATVINPSTNAPFLSQTDANTITTGIAKINAILASAQTGWPQALQTAWTTFKASLSPTQSQQLVVVLISGDVAIAALIAATSGTQPVLTPAQIDVLVHDARLIQDAR